MVIPIWKGAQAIMAEFPTMMVAVKALIPPFIAPGSRDDLALGTFHIHSLRPSSRPTRQIHQEPGEVLVARYPSIGHTYGKTDSQNHSSKTLHHITPPSQVVL